MKDRIKKIRDDYGMTLAEFGKRIKIGASSVGRFESGERSPSPQTIAMICNEFGVSETWLRTGEGEPYIQRSKEEQISALFTEVLKDDEDEFRRKVIQRLASYTKEDWELLNKALKLFLPEEHK